MTSACIGITPSLLCLVCESQISLHTGITHIATLRYQSLLYICISLHTVSHTWPFFQPELGNPRGSHLLRHNTEKDRWESEPREKKQSSSSSQTSGLVLCSAGPEGREFDLLFCKSLLQHSGIRSPLLRIRNKLQSDVLIAMVTKLLLLSLLTTTTKKMILKYRC